MKIDRIVVAKEGSPGDIDPEDLEILDHNSSNPSEPDSQPQHSGPDDGDMLD